MPRRFPRRIATISVHTSPLEQPGTGDAGGLNVYVVEVAKRMAARGVEVDIFTRAVSRDAPPVAELVPGVLVRHVPAGPFEELDKSDLPAQLCQFTFEVLRDRGRLRPRPVRPGARALLAVRPGRRGRQGALGRAAGAVHAHPGPGEERGAGARRRRRAGQAAARRGRGGRRRRPAGRQHRRGGPAARRALRGRPGQDLDRQPRRGPVGLPARAGRRRPGAGSACPPTVTSSCSRAGSSRSRRRTWCCAPPPAWSATTRPWPGP